MAAAWKNGFASPPSCSPRCARPGRAGSPCRGGSRLSPARGGAGGGGKPMSVRISANDWMGDLGVTPDEAVEIGRAFAEAGADLIDVSAGQTWADCQPVYGRMFQTPFADQVRNQGRLTTMAVGNIYEPDHVNSILAAGRADLVALARPHLIDPSWTLRAAAQQDYRRVAVPPPYLGGMAQLARNLQREAELKA